MPGRIIEVFSNRATSLIGPVILVPRVAPLTRFHCIYIILDSNIKVKFIFLENIDYDPTTITATFFAGSTTASVEIPIFNDTTVDEDDETLNLTLNLLSTTDVRVAPGIHSTATATIIDTSMYAYFIILIKMTHCTMHCI